MIDETHLNNKFVKDWLKYCGGSESPFLFNLWSGLTTVSACLGRRSFLEIGRFRYVPNMYVMLIGPPAVRKSSAGGIGKKLLDKYTDIKFGPTDTAGKKQGLISSYVRNYLTPEENLLDESILSEKTDSAEEAVTNAFAHMRQEKAKRQAKPPQELYIFADELTDFIGLNQIEMIGMLTSLYYPQDKYEYTLAKSVSYLHKPCLTLLGCTTPTSLAAHLPPASIGQGFTSRTIMVYEGRAKNKIYPAPKLDEKLELKLGAQLTELQHWAEEFSLTSDASKMLEYLYMNYKPDINDTRFITYEQRREDHINKLCMILAAAEGRTVIEGIDVTDAHMILEATEKNMPHALGEVGMDKLTIAKQSMKEMIEASWPMGVSISVLRTNMLRDMQARDFDSTLNEFINKGLCISDTRTVTMSGKNATVNVIIPAMPEDKKPASKQRNSRKTLDTLLNYSKATVNPQIAEEGFDSYRTGYDDDETKH